MVSTFSPAGQEKKHPSIYLVLPIRCCAERIKQFNCATGFQQLNVVAERRSRDRVISNIDLTIDAFELMIVGSTSVNPIFDLAKFI